MQQTTCWWRCYYWNCVKMFDWIMKNRKNYDLIFLCFLANYTCGFILCPANRNCTLKVCRIQWDQVDRWVRVPLDLCLGMERWDKDTWLRRPWNNSSRNFCNSSSRCYGRKRRCNSTWSGRHHPTTKAVPAWYRGCSRDLRGPRRLWDACLISLCLRQVWSNLELHITFFCNYSKLRFWLFFEETSQMGFSKTFLYFFFNFDQNISLFHEKINEI